MKKTLHFIRERLEDAKALGELVIGLVMLPTEDPESHEAASSVWMVVCCILAVLFTAWAIFSTW